jgi:hypothetical protein
MMLVDTVMNEFVPSGDPVVRRVLRVWGSAIGPRA